MQDPDVVALRFEPAHYGSYSSEAATAPLLDRIHAVGIVQMNERQYAFIRNSARAGAGSQEQNQDCEESAFRLHKRFRKSGSSVVDRILPAWTEFCDCGWQEFVLAAPDNRVIVCLREADNT